MKKHGRWSDLHHKRCFWEIKRIVTLFVSFCLCVNICACDKQGERALLFQNLKVGDIVSFGRYEQDNLMDNGTENIEWEVLEIDGDKALLICRSIITGYQYNSNDMSITWEDSTLRAWLNSSFLETAFSQDEQEYILSSSISTQSVHQKFYSSLQNTYGI